MAQLTAIDHDPFAHDRRPVDYDPFAAATGAVAGDWIADAVSGYIRDLMSGKIAASGPLGQNHYDPNRSFAQNALDPRAIENAADVAMGVSGGGMGIRAYHGSPHDFDKFDISKIGTGEGAQAYGHGLYFAEAEPVAASYRTAGTSPWAGGQQHAIAAKALSDAQAGGLTGDGARSSALDALNKQALALPASVRRPIFDAINNFDALIARPPGRMYEVNINADPEQFLNWDKPLLDQPQGVQDVVSRVLNPAPPVIATDVRRGTLGGGGTYQALAERFARPAIEDIPGVPRGWGAVAGAVNDRAYNGIAASDALNQAGIPGIRYLDQGSRGAGQGTSNYVVFDPSIIDIIRKYGVAGLITTGAIPAGQYMVPVDHDPFTETTK